MYILFDGRHVTQTYLTFATAWRCRDVALVEWITAVRLSGIRMLVVVFADVTVDRRTAHTYQRQSMTAA